MALKIGGPAGSEAMAAGLCGESEIDGMFVVGESAGVHGILAAGIMGAMACDAACK